MLRLKCPKCGCISYVVLWEKDHICCVSTCGCQHEVHFSSKYDDFKSRDEDFNELF